ncbi:MAG: hypothetical protein KF693_16400 [Nitrospira sp.]|nr:hypothetical protein [Nitrospira sp.]
MKVRRYTEGDRVDANCLIFGTAILGVVAAVVLAVDATGINGLTRSR